MKEDSMEIEILADGTIKVITDQISPANHLSADSFLKMIETLAGGEIKRTKNRQVQAHVYQYGRLRHSHFRTEKG